MVHITQYLSLVLLYVASTDKFLGGKKIYVAGSNSSGQLGIPSAKQITTPIKITTHTCTKVFAGMDRTFIACPTRMKLVYFNNTKVSGLRKYLPVE